MKLGICFFTLMALLAAADKPDQKREPAKSKPPAVTALPPGAVDMGSGAWRYTDAAGKKWIYRTTPFGLARFEDKAGSPEASDAERKQQELTTAVEDGDSVRFTRPGPFGPYRWKRKKAELDQTEQAVWDRERAKKKTASPGKDAKE